MSKSLVRKQIANGAKCDEGIVRTTVFCHECGKYFIAVVDYSIDGEHEVICPICGHRHCRTIKDGIITEDRWSSRNSKDNVTRDGAERLWIDKDTRMKTLSTAEFLRDTWLNHGR